jgi:hypothetical protein
MYFFNNKIAIKQSVPIPGAPKQDYKFNEVTGYPDDVLTQANDLQKQWAGKPMVFAKHVYDQAGKNSNGESGIHGFHPDNIPNINKSFPLPEHGFKPVEIEHDGNNITKLVMRGPFSDTHDITMPIVRGQNGGPFATTLYGNTKEDDRSADSNRRPLDLNRIHLPEEFKQGKRPRRQLVSDDVARQRDYQHIPVTRQKSRQRIIDQYGYKPPQPPQEGM